MTTYFSVSFGDDLQNLGHELAMAADVGDYLAVLVNDNEGWMIGKTLPPDEGARLWGQDGAVMAEASQHPSIATRGRLGVLGFVILL